MLKGGREAVGGEISPNHSPSLILITRNVASSCVTEITDSLWCPRSTKVSVNFGTQEASFTQDRTPSTGDTRVLFKHS